MFLDFFLKIGPSNLFSSTIPKKLNKPPAPALRDIGGVKIMTILEVN